MRLVAVLFMSGEKLSLFLYRVPNGNVVIDLKLTTALNSKVSKLKWVVFSLQSFISISASVHQVDFGNDTDGTFAFGVHLPGQLKRVRRSDVNVGRCQCKDQGVLGQHKSQDHLSDLILNVGWLAFDRHFCKTRKVNHSQIDHIL